MPHSVSQNNQPAKNKPRKSKNGSVDSPVNSREMYSRPSVMLDRWAKATTSNELPISELLLQSSFTGSTKR